MRRTTAFLTSQLLSLATTKIASTASEGTSFGGPNISRGGGLFFADRAVKMTRLTTPGFSLICKPSILSCESPDATAAVRLITEEPGKGPSARIQLVGMCTVSFFRSHRIVFHCTGEQGRVQRHEIGLKNGDVLAVLRGCDLMRDWKSVERTLRSVAGEDPEYMAEEILLKLASDARATTNGNALNNAGSSVIDDDDNINTNASVDGKEVSTSDSSMPNGICIMTVVRNRPSEELPQPPSYLNWSMACGGEKQNGSQKKGRVGEMKPEFVQLR
ncbi:hypothetical protein C3747_17g572 [Trypanosoma cruzi]|uniref:Uncharacterized protein n=3 Tax=Trypanosoma cruzi TaxID=5693 RepID=Q4DB23_TRYCC|nr:hypothetical protein, conserved [Trypanosoma cruzi]EAN89725.1 hypothetical protein, conserved [Trypanosoma cruzi]KAF8281664.1 hypothetical protein TcYC6_0007090 [Trypanosoma cruzi]PWV17650.1 hypothetical protein C3747_17g572 [Trypanosoma cruzi]|eukprot:XP_811576.1 hypothetical protein [Trypanosoma cruzi strain CL Brener]